jgi:hypothetical protein
MKTAKRILAVILLAVRRARGKRIFSVVLFVFCIHCNVPFGGLSANKSENQE